MTFYLSEIYYRKIELHIDIKHWKYILTHPVSEGHDGLLDPRS